MKTLTLVRINRVVRTASFAWCLAAIALYLSERQGSQGAGYMAWALLVVQFAIYPQLVYWRALHSDQPNAAERHNLYLDSTLLGVWSAYLGFPIWIAWMLVGPTLLNAVVNRALPGLAISLGCSALGAAFWILIDGWHFTPDTSAAVSLLCMLGGIVYTCTIGYLVFMQTHRLAAARDQIVKSEERYRLIAENADDLVAMLDSAGRWLYTSPSYARIFNEAELAVGSDALDHVHPDDAQNLRKALFAARARELPLRLVDREGRVRQYRCHLQPLTQPEGLRFLLVSHDVTDLKESEERMLLAAHALEGMTEGIMITSADGTIVSVNRAFAAITGHDREEVLGKSAKDVRSNLNPPEFFDEARATAVAQGYWSGTTWSKRRNGSVYREWRSIRTVRDAAGTPTHFVHVFYEVGARQNGGRPASTAG